MRAQLLIVSHFLLPLFLPAPPSIISTGGEQPVLEPLLDLHLPEEGRVQGGQGGAQQGVVAFRQAGQVAVLRKERERERERGER